MSFAEIGPRVDKHPRHQDQDQQHGITQRRFHSSEPSAGITGLMETPVSGSAFLFDRSSPARAGRKRSRIMPIPKRRIKAAIYTAQPEKEWKKPSATAVP